MNRKFESPSSDSGSQTLQEMNEALQASSVRQKELTEMAEAAAADGEARLRDVIEALPAAVFTTDAEGWLTHFNGACVELFGRTPQIGSDQWSLAWKLFNADGMPLPHEQCPMARSLREGRSIRGVETIAERPDGTRVWLAPYPTPFKDANGIVVGGINMLIDITERKAAEASNARSAAIVESSDDAIVSKDLTSIITSWNHGAELLFGYTAEEMIGKSVTLLIPPDQVDEEPAILDRIRRGERIEHYHTTRRRKDGTLIDVSLTVSPIKDTSGRIVGAAKIARDISEQKRAEKALRRNAATLAALVEQSPLGIYTVDADFRVRHVSVGAASAFRNVSPIIGRDFAEVMHILWPDSFANEAIAVFRRVIETGEAYVSPGLTEQRQDIGAIESYEWQVSPVELDDGRLGAVCYYFDATRLQQANQALRESEERLEEEVQLRTADLLAVNEQLQGFTYSVAHDLRQQIRGISANAAMIMSDSAELLDEESQVTLRRLIDSSKKLGKLVDDLLTYARLGKTEPTRVPLDLTAMSEEVAAFLIENGTCRRGTRFRIARNLVSNGDAQLVRIVLENLIDNACKYSAKTENPVIEVNQEDEEFVIRDNGIGFDMRFEPKLFQPFERLHRDSIYAGTGIGLANVKRIVERHGGKVRAEGKLGEGAAFFFTLP